MLSRIAGLAATCLAALLVGAPAALGHAAFLEATPAAGSSVQTPPDEVVLEFTEPLNRKLSDAEIAVVGGGGRPSVGVLVRDRTRLVLRPRNPLPRAAYRVRWHTVSTEDGHALEGTVGFGVGVPAAGGSQEIEQSPLARGGWLRALARFAFYASLLFFAGGVFCSAALGRRWPADEERAWRRTLDAGVAATVAGVAVALVEAADAGSLSAPDVSEFLLSNTAGVGRVAAVLLTGLACLLALRGAAAAAVPLALAFLAIALSGHANSADPRWPAVVTDWIHLLAAGVWAGGIAQIGAAWARQPSLDAVRRVLPRFGRLALPAFLAVVASGLANAVIELGGVSALWDTGYGLVLLAKIVLVALVALASYVHVYRLRPRLLAANPHPAPALERTHWRLLRAEPALLAAAVAAAALLVVFPLPPRQLSESGSARAAGVACSPCPLPRPGADELSVAAPAGTHVAAIWVRRGGGELRTLDRKGRPVDDAVTVAGGTACGRGCTRFTLPAGARELSARVGSARVKLPAVWQKGGERRARELLARAQETMRSLRTLRHTELTSSGPGETARVRYLLAAPDRLEWRTDRGVHTVVIGGTQWMSVNGGPWQKGPWTGGGSFRFRSWFRWSAYARTVRLLSERHGVAEIALFDEASPAWYRLRIDTRSLRVLESHAVAPARFIDDRFSDFDRPLRIEPPRGVAP